MVRFQHQNVTAAQMITYAGRHIPQIGGHAHLDALAAKREAYGIGSVVWDGKWSHRDIADLKTSPRRKELNPLRIWKLSGRIPHRPRPRLVRSAGHEHRDSQLASQYQQARNVIRMLVSDDDGRQRLRIVPCRLYAFASLAAGNSRVHQDAR